MARAADIKSPGGLILKHRWMLWALFFAAWMLIGLAWTLNYYLFSDTYVAIFSQPTPLKKWLSWELLYWIIWAVLSPLIFWIARRFPVERTRWLRPLLIQVAVGLCLALIHRAVYLLAGFLLYHTPYYPLTDLLKLDRHMLLFNLPNGFLCYGTILLVSHVIDYYQRYQEEELKASHLKAELAEAQLQVTQAQLQALKMQLQPHFLFNTLNSISALLDEDIGAADEMLARLGDFLRLTLENSGAQEVSLQEELEFLRCYLEIEQIRFQDRLTVDLEIDPQALEARVPNLILQPIVENAIRHGIAPQLNPGRIVIRAKRDDGLLRLQVKDNGSGLSTSERSGHKFKGGLGLANTRARLEQLYGSAYRLELVDAAEGGLEVILEIPFRSASGIATYEPIVIK